MKGRTSRLEQEPVSASHELVFLIAMRKVSDNRIGHRKYGNTFDPKNALAESCFKPGPNTVRFWKAVDAFAKNEGYGSGISDR